MRSVGLLRGHDLHGSLSVQMGRPLILVVRRRHVVHPLHDALTTCCPLPWNGQGNWSGASKGFVLKWRHANFDIFWNPILGIECSSQNSFHKFPVIKVIPIWYLWLYGIFQRRPIFAHLFDFSRFNAKTSGFYVKFGACWLVSKPTRREGVARPPWPTTTTLRLKWRTGKGSSKLKSAESERTWGSWAGNIAPLYLSSKWSL